MRYVSKAKCYWQHSGFLLVHLVAQSNIEWSLQVWYLIFARFKMNNDTEYIFGFLAKFYTEVVDNIFSENVFVRHSIGNRYQPWHTCTTGCVFYAWNWI